MRKSKQPMRKEHDWHVGAYMLHVFMQGRWPVTTAYSRIK